MISAIRNTITEFRNVLLSLPEEVYSQPSSLLSGASIGAHTRHIIELYQELLKGYSTGDVSYDNRKRDKKIETDLTYAIQSLDEITALIMQQDKSLTLTYQVQDKVISLNTNYHRELMYNLEHTIHHQALIRVGIESMCGLPLPAHFGVAPSTMQHRALCAQ
jgi:uncharacterized damage-inducible protein DinB